MRNFKELLKVDLGTQNVYFTRDIKGSGNLETIVSSALPFIKKQEKEELRKLGNNQGKNLETEVEKLARKILERRIKKYYRKNGIAVLLFKNLTIKPVYARTNNASVVNLEHNIMKINIHVSKLNTFRLAKIVLHEFIHLYNKYRNMDCEPCQLGSHDGCTHFAAEHKRLKIRCMQEHTFNEAFVFYYTCKNCKARIGFSKPSENYICPSCSSSNSLVPESVEKAKAQNGSVSRRPRIKASSTNFNTEKKGI